MSKPLHIEVLEKLLRTVNTRREKHLELCGQGVADQVYQRHVGRIAECSVLRDEIEDAIRRGDDTEENISEESNPPRNRRGKSSFRGFERDAGP